MPNNLIRVKQLDQSELSGFFAQTAVNTGIIPPIVNNIGSGLFVSLSANQTIIGDKTFLDNINVSGTGTFNSLDLNNIDTLSLSGVDVTITSGHVGIGINNNNFDLYVRKTAAGVTVSPDSNSIAVFEGSGNSHITILASNSASAGVVIGSPADNFGSYLTWNHDNHALKLGTAKPSGFIQLLTNDEVEAVRITSGANVGIGTNNPSEKLQVVGNVKVSGNLTVNNTGVLLSGQNSFVIPMSSSSSNLTFANTMYYFSLGSAGYAVGRNDRQFPFLDACIVKKVSFSIQQLSASTVGSNVTGFFINSTKNLTGIIFSGKTTVSDGNFYTFSRNDLNIPFAANDSGVCAIFSTTTNPSNIRSMVNAHCYN